jgi:hypothetical protein
MPQKMKRDEEVKLGRRKISEGIWCLAFLINRCSQGVALSLFDNIDSEFISKSSSIYQTAASHFCILLVTPPPVTRPTTVFRAADSDPGPSKHIPSKSTAVKLTRNPSAALRESTSSQQMLKRRREPETAAMITNCDLAIEGGKEA